VKLGHVEIFVADPDGNWIQLVDPGDH